MPPCSKRVGDGERQSAKVQQWSPGFFSSLSMFGWQTNKEGTKIVGCSVMGSLECKEQSLFWESPTISKGNSGRGIGVTGNISAGYGFLRKYISLDEDYCRLFLSVCIKG